MYGSNPESRNVRNEYVSINRGLNSRQQPVDAAKNECPVSNYTTAKYQSERKKPIVMQPKPQPSTARDRVKFNSQKNKHFVRKIPQEQIKKNHKTCCYNAQDKKLYDVLTNGELYNSCMNSEIDSVYSSNFYYDDDNESEIESLYDPNDYTRRSLERMETRLNTMTNRFITKVKSQVDETFSKLKMQSKLNNVKPKAPKKDDGSGEPKKHNAMSFENDMMIKKMIKVRMDVYEKIDKNLKVLKHVDRLTEELYKNHIDDAQKQ